jgi:hypothetical protein
VAVAAHRDQLRVRPVSQRDIAAGVLAVMVVLTLAFAVHVLAGVLLVERGAAPPRPATPITRAV